MVEATQGKQGGRLSSEHEAMEMVVVAAGRGAYSCAFLTISTESFSVLGVVGRERKQETLPK